MLLIIDAPTIASEFDIDALKSLTQLKPNKETTRRADAFAGDTR
jgi:hypothetical protein